MELRGFVENILGAGVCLIACMLTVDALGCSCNYGGPALWIFAPTAFLVLNNARPVRRLIHRLIG